MDNQKETEQHIPANFTTHRTAWRDAITECINVEMAKGDRDRAAYWEHELAAYDRSFARLLDEPEADTELVTMQAMAECMDMVRQELVEAGVIAVSVPPMFVAEAVLGYVRTLGADLRSTLVELTAVQRKLIDANAEIAVLLLARDAARNFCGRCGKRLTTDLVHTCTPPAGAPA